MERAHSTVDVRLPVLDFVLFYADDDKEAADDLVKRLNSSGFSGYLYDDMTLLALETEEYRRTELLVRNSLYMLVYGTESFFAEDGFLSQHRGELLAQTVHNPEKKNSVIVIRGKQVCERGSMGWGFNALIVVDCNHPSFGSTMHSLFNSSVAMAKRRAKEEQQQRQQQQWQQPKFSSSLSLDSLASQRELQRGYSNEPESSLSLDLSLGLSPDGAVAGACSVTGEDHAYVLPQADRAASCSSGCSRDLPSQPAVPGTVLLQATPAGTTSGPVGLHDGAISASSSTAALGMPGGAAEHDSASNDASTARGPTGALAMPIGAADHRADDSEDVPWTATRSPTAALAMPSGQREIARRPLAEPGRPVTHEDSMHKSIGFGLCSDLPVEATDESIGSARYLGNPNGELGTTVPPLSTLQPYSLPYGQEAADWSSIPRSVVVQANARTPDLPDAGRRRDTTTISHEDRVVDGRYVYEGALNDGSAV